MSAPTIAVLGAGAMGSKMAQRLSESGCGPILTNLDGRSETTRTRAKQCGMQHASYSEIVSQASYILSVVPPKDAFAIAESIAAASKALTSPSKVIFADCNAVSSETAKNMAKLFEDTEFATFIDGAIVGGPPSELYNPALYISADKKDEKELDELDSVLKRYGLQPFVLKGEGSGVGDASAVKMANSGVVKGAIALFTTMILSKFFSFLDILLYSLTTNYSPASHASSPSTAQGLLHSLYLSQPDFIPQMIRLVPQMIPKAYRFIGEMGEVAQSSISEGSTIYEGTAQVFERIAKAQADDTQAPGDGGDIDVLLSVIEEAKKLWATDQAVTWVPPS